MFSFWEKNSFIKSPDVIVIGAGIVGLNAAISIKKKSPGLHIIVLERGMLPFGASTRNAGFACYGSPSELLEDLQNYPKEEVYSLVEKRWRGLNRLRNILGDDKIDYKDFGGYEIFSPDDRKLYADCHALLPELNRNLKEITGVQEMYTTADDKIKTFGFENVNHIIVNRGEGQIDTGKMMKSLYELAIHLGITVFNGANVESVDNNENNVMIKLSGYVETPLKTKRLLLCTNGFARQFLPGLDIAPARAQVLITKPVQELTVKGSFHFDRGYYYFRNVGNRLMFGGGRNLDFEKEETEEFGISQRIQSTLDNMLEEMILPKVKYEVEMRWSGIMGIGKTKTPIIKKIDDNIFCAVRLGGMGIAIGSLTGEEAADMVLNSL